MMRATVSSVQFVVIILAHINFFPHILLSRVGKIDVCSHRLSSG
jgi:hypothetical protein